MKRKHKVYSRPKRPFEKNRIIEEGGIKEEFGLKNKKEIWKAESKIKQIRERAKESISASQEEQSSLFERLRKMGFKVNSIADVLSLDKKDYLKRRLQTVLVERNLASTTKRARQLITHKKVLVDGRIVNIPSYLVSVALESKISLVPMKQKKIEVSKIEEIQNDVEDSRELNEAIAQ